MSDKDELSIEVPTDEELFDQPDEPKAEEAEAKEEAPVEAEASEEAPEEDKAQGESHRVPLTELLNEREKRQQIQAQYEAQQRQLEEWNIAYQQQQAQSADVPDIFENPEYYQEAVASIPQYINQALQQQAQQYNQQMAMQRMEMMGEMSLQAAKRENPEKYDHAWQELERRVSGGDNTWRLRVLQSPDPGGELLKLYEESNLVEGVGGDPEAYFQKRLDELKHDPQFQAEVLAAQSQQSQSPRINLPPSLNKAGGGGPNAPFSISGNDLWDEINK